MIAAVTATLAQVRAPLLWGFGGVFSVMLIASALVLILPVLKPAGDWRELRLRVWSWWVMIALLAGALALGWVAVTLLFAAVAFIALREFLSLAPLRREDRLVVLFAYLSIPLSFGLIALGWYGVYLVAIPVWFFLATPFLMAIGGQTKAYLATVATITWAVIVCVFNLGVIPLLMRAPDESGTAGAAGMVFLLLLATEANDVLQYCCGKLFGRHKIIPAISPNKTWEGFIGGWILTAALIWVLTPVFTPMTGYPVVVLAVLLPLAGFAGDVTMSAVKRDLGVKDTSRLIPGHGGLLDRIDSLTFTAPLFFHLMAYYALDKY
ncbi:phosphatidate cytidylyltransferase [Brevundimonas sp.]|uniref:phosphatidate cytidylyltransferase n=1 Tax=Brevundimonas sp. TaxID=1871086 RepID=UPI002487F9EE|nr:phosphatidate cytidylyltransferase [Brevundimonas sp.]MDI1281634.1 phosphatidate cytidylyltransferase [Brevundimonas sp.]